MKSSKTGLTVLLLLASLLTLPSVAAAQTTSAPPACYPTESAARNFKLTTNPDGNLAFLAAGPDAYFIMTWWCHDPVNPSGNLVVGYKSDLLPDFANFIERFLSSDKTTKDGLFRSVLACPRGSDPALPACARYNSLLPIARTQMAANRPPLPPAPTGGWRVADNPQGTTRPVYPVANGVRSANATRERIADNASCSCTTTQVTEGTLTYCSVSGQANVSLAPRPTIDPNRVALCVRQ